MQVHTRKPPTSQEFITLTLKVPAALAPAIRGYADELIKQESSAIPWRDSFKKHFPDQTISAVSLQSARAAKGLTQKQLSELVTIPQRHISEMENGKRNIGKERARRLAEVLDTDYRLFL